MMVHKDDTERFTNPTKLADEAVFALSCIERGSEASQYQLQEGITLCEYLIHLIESSRSPSVEGRRHVSGTVCDDSKALMDSGISVDEAIEKTRQVKKWISDLIINSSSHSKEDIELIKEHLISITMPMWRKRTSEFRDRKMKRSLFIRG